MPTAATWRSPPTRKTRSLPCSTVSCMSLTVPIRGCSSKSASRRMSFSSRGSVTNSSVHSPIPTGATARWGSARWSRSSERPAERSCSRAAGWVRCGATGCARSSAWRPWTPTPPSPREAKAYTAVPCWPVHRGCSRTHCGPRSAAGPTRQAPCAACPPVAHLRYGGRTRSPWCAAPNSVYSRTAHGRRRSAARTTRSRCTRSTRSRRRVSSSCCWACRSPSGFPGAGSASSLGSALPFSRSITSGWSPENPSPTG